MTEPTETVLAIKDLHVRFDSPDGTVEAVRGVDMHVCAGETVAIVGASGSGKSQVMMAAMGLLAKNGRATGSVLYRGQELLQLPTGALNRIRGKKITMIFQEPMTSLDPLYTVERQICEPLIVHGGLSAAQASQRALELLNLVHIPEPERRLRSYPHELSGGQRQRVMIAMALANNPDILIADEPTTALDVTVQAEILGLLAELQQTFGMAILFITHDLRIVEATARRVYVMKDGRVVEHGPTAEIFAAPAEDYTRMLLAAEPEGRKAPVPHDAPTLLQASDITVTFETSRRLFGKPALFKAVDGVSLSLRTGQTIGIVGESGSGKSTLGRALVRLQRSEGRIVYLGREIQALDRKGIRPLRRSLQMVFQDPYGSLSPRMTVNEIVAEGLLVHEPKMSRAARRAAVADALRAVDLDPAIGARFPHEFSGGQRQRIAIARVLVLRPSLVVLDEPTSALDRWVQKQIVTLLRDLQQAHGLTYIFISHDLAVVRAVSDYTMVMKSGQVVEEGPTEQIFEAPQTAYTRQLIHAALNLKQTLATNAQRRSEARETA